jgi:hypothetical protein
VKAADATAYAKLTKLHGQQRKQLNLWYSNDKEGYSEDNLVRLQKEAAATHEALTDLVEKYPSGVLEEPPPIPQPDY